METKKINYWDKYRAITEDCLEETKKLFREHNADELICPNVDDVYPLVLTIYNNNGDAYNEEIQRIVFDKKTQDIKLYTEYGEYDLINDTPRESIFSVYDKVFELLNE